MCFPKLIDTDGIILLLIGLDSAGKSSFLMRLRNGSGIPPKSGWGFSVDMVQYQPSHSQSSWWRPKGKRKMIKIYDLGGDQKIRGIWKNYLAEVHGCIYVIDGENKNRLAESKDALIDIYQNAKLFGKPLLLAVNHKGDINIDAIFNEMDLSCLFTDESSMQKSLRIQPCDVSFNPQKEPYIDPRIREGFNWIVDSVQQQSKTLEFRRKADIKQELKEKLDRKRTLMPIIDKNLRRHRSKVVPELI